MDKSQNKESKLTWMVRNFAAISFFAVLYSHAVITFFYAGYLNSFGINIEDINFWPKITDFAVYGAPLLFLVAVSTFLCWLAIYLINSLLSIMGKKAKRSNVRSIVKDLAMPQSYVISTLILAVLMLSIYSIYLQSYPMGEDRGQNRKVFSRVLMGDDNTHLLVYQNGNTGVVKRYNPSAKEFDEGYQVVDLTDLSYERVEIVRQN